jgi:dipeptidase E
MAELLLLSNSVSPGRGYLEHALDMLGELVPRGGALLFVPFAAAAHDAYTERIAAALAPLGATVTGAHQVSDAARAAREADAVFVGGGNSFRLLAELERTGLSAAIPEAVRAGRAYIGSSAGTNMACPSLRTTNDMPIVQPDSFRALGLVPFQVNAHYIDAGPAGYQGETRADRIEEFLECNDVPVIGLREGAWIRVSGDRAWLGGGLTARVFSRDCPGGKELADGSDLSEYLAAVPRFDVPRFEASGESS